LGGGPSENVKKQDVKRAVLRGPKKKKGNEMGGGSVGVQVTHRERNGNKKKKLGGTTIPEK